MKEEALDRDNCSKHANDLNKLANNRSINLSLTESFSVSDEVNPIKRSEKE